MKRRDPIQVDQGWAWVICSAGFVVHALFNCSGQTNTILLGELIDRHDTTITTISLMFTAGILANSLFSVLTATFMLPKMSARVCIILGGFMSSLASIGQGFSGHVVGVILCEALRGSSQGILLVALLSLVPQYFSKHKSTASVTILSGGCVAGIIAPFVIRVLRLEFGLSGTYLLLSALELNICVAGLLFRPVDSFSQSDSVNVQYPLETNKIPQRLYKLHKFYQDTSLNHWGFRLALVACVPGVVFVYLIVYTPTILVNQGATQDEVVILLTILGLLDLISRVVMGLVADRRVMTATTLLVISHIYTGVFCQCVRLFTTFQTMIAYVILLGPVIGARYSLIPSVVMEVVGTDNMPQAFSIVSMLTTLLGGAVFPIFGAIADTSGSFILGLHIVGVCMTIGGLLWSAVPFLVRMDIKSGRRK
ncbi:hypothetical protein Btru_061595 [Bulinus truncatus]|nr:hypothetical protein Btru_061595 [Bulinus truncatus]